MQLNPLRVKALRDQRSWTQHHLADACSVSIRTIQRVEKEGLASKETTMSLCAAFGVTQGKLITFDEPELIHHQGNNRRIKGLIITTACVSFSLGMASAFLILNF